MKVLHNVYGRFENLKKYEKVEECAGHSVSRTLKKRSSITIFYKHK